MNVQLGPFDEIRHKFLFFNLKLVLRVLQTGQVVLLDMFFDPLNVKKCPLFAGGSAIWQKLSLDTIYLVEENEIEILVIFFSTEKDQVNRRWHFD